MKRCPQCSRVFEDALEFCTEDGRPLVAEAFGLPSALAAAETEEETVIRPASFEIPNPSIEIPIAAAEIPAAPSPVDFPPPAVETVIVEKRSGTARALVFLLIGLLAGGTLVLAAVAAGLLFFRSRTPVAENAPPAVNRAPSPVRTTASPALEAAAEHERRTDVADDEFNGRVIAPNAFVRAAPSRSARRTDILPIADRLTIRERENESSPWYRVTCEHGATGWMHGNTIEYTR